MNDVGMRQRDRLRRRQAGGIQPLPFDDGLGEGRPDETAPQQALA